MKITKILLRRGRIYEVHFDDDTYINIDRALADSLAISVGDEISDEKANALEDKSDMLRCMNRAMYYLASSSISEKNLRAKLIKAGFAPKFVESAINRCRELGYINDDSLALRLKEKCEQSAVSQRNTVEKLVVSGISREKAKEICLYDSAVEQAKIEKLLSTKYKNRLTNEDGVRKTVNSLIRLGFKFYDIKSVLKDMLEE